MWGIDWNPISWFSSVGDIPSAVLGEIKKWVGKAINFAIKALIKLLNHLFGSIAKLVNGIAHQLSIVVGLANDAAHFLANFQIQVLNVITHWADSFLHHQVLNFIEVILRPVWDAINLADNAVGTIVHAFKGISSSTIGAVVNFVNNFGHMLDGWWNTARKVFIHDVVDPVVHAVETVSSDVAHVVHTVETDVMAAVHLVQKVAPLLEKLAQYTLSDIEALFSHGLPGRGGKIVNEGVSLLSSEEKVFVDLVNKFFE